MPPSERDSTAAPHRESARSDSPSRAHEVTRLLWRWKEGDEAAFERLFPLVYDELRRLARSQMARERGSETLQPTALVHESYLRLVEADVEWESRGHFLAIAARVMRQVLVDEARRRRAEKRGSGQRPVTIEGLGELAIFDDETRLLALDQAMNRLADLDERRARVVELRFFAGLSIQEACKVLDLSHATVERDLKFALAWLRRELATPEPE